MSIVKRDRASCWLLLTTLNMPPLAQAMKLNASFFPKSPKAVALFFGVTSGIGQAMARRYTEYTRGESQSRSTPARTPSLKSNGTSRHLCRRTDKKLLLITSKHTRRRRTPTSAHTVKPCAITRPALLLVATAGPPSSPPQPMPPLALAPLSRAAPLASPCVHARVPPPRPESSDAPAARGAARTRKRAVAVYNVDGAVAREVEIKVLYEEEDAVDGMEEHEMQESEGKDEDEDSLLRAAFHAVEGSEGCTPTVSPPPAFAPHLERKTVRVQRRPRRAGTTTTNTAKPCATPPLAGTPPPSGPASAPRASLRAAPLWREASPPHGGAEGVANAVDGTKGHNEDKNSLQRAYKRAARSSKHSSYIVDRQLSWRSASRQEKAATRTLEYAQLKPEGGFTEAEGDAKADGRGSCRYGPGAAGLLGVVQGIRYCMTWALGLLSRLWPGYLVGRADYVFAAEDTGGRGIVPPARRGGGCASR
ncbi:hypothetical protein B0H14DRAFT_3486425 [Mycena olivaceomarginata]|nr:hypothetical protein B0H14DRAFT_3486425 [Mycena olivaceomarginata]